MTKLLIYKTQKNCIYRFQRVITMGGYFIKFLNQNWVGAETVKQIYNGLISSSNNENCLLRTDLNGYTNGHRNKW